MNKAYVFGWRVFTCGLKPLALLALFALSSSIFAETLDARLHWVQRVALGTPVSGVIAEVTVMPGYRAQKGQLLLRLDTRPLQARIDGLEAKRISRVYDRDEAKRELMRTQELYDRTLLADHDLDLAKIALANAEAALKTTEAQLTQARWELEYSQIRAPFDAWILRRNAEPGQTVVSTLQAGPLIVVARAGTMLARMMIDGARISAFKLGQVATVSVGADSYRGSVQRVGLEPAEKRLYPVDVQFDTGGRTLRAGLPASIELP